jgi:hypothetical protein
MFTLFTVISPGTPGIPAGKMLLFAEDICDVARNIKSAIAEITGFIFLNFFNE